MRPRQFANSRGRTGLLILLIALFAVSCVSIKPSTVELSAQVGERIGEMERIHQLAVQRYFDMEQQKIEDFMTKTWEPLFLKNFLGTSNVLQMLQNVSAIDDKGRTILKEGIAVYLRDKTEADKAANELVGKLTDARKGESGVVRGVLTKFVEDKQLDAAVIHISSLLGTDEPARIIFDFTEAAHQKMQERRKEVLAPIVQARHEAMASLSQAYSDLIRGQSTITGRLEAASRRSKQQDELLGKLGIKNISDDLATKLANISEKVNQGLSAANEVIEKKKDGSSDNIIKLISDALKQTPDKK